MLSKLQLFMGAFCLGAVAHNLFNRSFDGDTVLKAIIGSILLFTYAQGEYQKKIEIEN